MESLKSKLLNYLPKDKLLNCLGFHWPVINYRGENTQKHSMCKTFGFCLQSMFDPNFQVSLSYADELGNFHPVSLSL